jgi:hypothetical protein
MKSWTFSVAVRVMVTMGARILLIDRLGILPEP